MTALAIGASVTVSVRDGGTVAIATNGGSASATIALTEGGTSAVSFGPLPERRVLGPFREGATVTLANASCGSLDYDAGEEKLATRMLASDAKLRPQLKATAAPPTITLSAVGAATSITNGRTIKPKRHDTDATLWDVDGDGAFNAIGCPNGKMLVDSTDLARPDFLTGGSSQAARWRTSWEWEHTGQVIEVITRALATSLDYRLFIDDEPVSLTPTTLSGLTAAGRYRLVLDFGSVGTRRIRYEPSDPYFGGVTVEPTATVQRTTQSRRRFVVLSDSTGAGASGVTAPVAWPFWTSELLGMECWNLSIGGTGYLNGGGTSSYIDRIEDVINADPDVLFIAGGQNDKAPFTVAQIIAAARTLLATFRLRIPVAQIVLGGIHMTSDALDVKNEPLETALRALAREFGIPFVSLRDPRNRLATTAPWAPLTAYKTGDYRVRDALVWVCTAGHTSAASWARDNWTPTSFLSGTGKIGSTTGEGNSDLFMLSDGIHYSAAGHYAQGLWEAARLLPYLSGRSADHGGIE